MAIANNQMLALQQEAERRRQQGSGENVGSTNQALNGGAALSYGATGAAMGAATGNPIIAAAGGIGGAIYGLFSGDGTSNEAPAPPPSQYGGNPLTNQLAAQQYAAGLQQQQAQNAREAAFYNQSNGNYDIANAMQMRQGPQIQGSQADLQRQLAALQGTNAATGNVNMTGNQLTDLGTKPMGPSYAEAQLRQGQDSAMAQQLSMARSGRSLGSGQAAMQQAAFNNVGINQQTNQAAASARIQEQNAYNQFQANALSAAGQQYGAAGALSGQAGNQATGVRQGNEGLQAQNANLQLQQQGVNNQTTGLYNQLGAQQQQLGMQANSQGQNAYQFGANQASGMQGAQLNADTGRLSSTTQTNIANQNNANAHDAANMNMVSSAFGTASDMVGNANATPSASSAPMNPNNPSGSTSPYQNITTASNTAGGNGLPGSRSSDERKKTNIKALDALGAGALGDTRARPDPLPTAPANNPNKYAEFSPEDAAIYQAADRKSAMGLDPGGARMDEGTNLVAAPGESGSPTVGPQTPSYADTIAALNAAYRPSQNAPTDVLNHVPGAGAGTSNSQAALLASLGAPTGQRPPPKPTGLNANKADLQTPPEGFTAVPTTTGQLFSAAHKGMDSGLISGTSAAKPYTPAQIAAAGPVAPTNWGDVFNAPTLDPRIQDYLNGANPYPVAAPTAPTPQMSGSFNPIEYRGNEAAGTGFIGDKDYDTNRLAGQRSSDVHSKTRIRELESQLAALQGPPSASFAPQRPDRAGLDAAYAREQNAPAIDLRPAQGYSYEYKDPRAPGAAPGRHVGPMAQDLEHTAAAGTVRDTPHGKVVDTEGLTMVNTAALSEQQRKTQELERQLAALSGAQPAGFNPSLYPSTRSPY